MKDRKLILDLFFKSDYITSQDVETRFIKINTTTSRLVLYRHTRPGIRKESLALLFGVGNIFHILYGTSNSYCPNPFGISRYKKLKNKSPSFMNYV